jgi:hypothetical protein
MRTQLARTVLLASLTYAVLAGCGGVSDSSSDEQVRPATKSAPARTATTRPARTTTTEPEYYDDIDESFYEETADPWAGEPSGPPGPFIDRATGQFWCVHPNTVYVACSENAYFNGWYYQSPETGETVLVNRWGKEAVCTMPDGSSARC